MQKTKAQGTFLKSSIKKVQAQGTIEYLIVIAIIIIMGLAIVSLMNGSISPANGVSNSLTKTNNWTNAIALTESSVTPDGNYLIRLANNSGEELTITTVKIGDNNANYSTDLYQGNAQNFVINSDDLCSTGNSTTQTVTITYISKNGIRKTETYPINTYFNCENYTVNLLADQCPATTYSGTTTISEVKTGSTFYNNSSTLLTGTGTQYLSPDTNTLTAGYYDTNNLSLIDTDLNAENITSGVEIFGVTGTASGAATLTWGELETGTMDWSTALNTCAEKNSTGYGGANYEGWRLPTVEELDAKKVDIPGENLWSSSTVPTASTYTYFLYDGTYYGDVSFISDDAIKTDNSFLGVRCVHSE